MTGVPSVSRTRVAPDLAVLDAACLLLPRETGRDGAPQPRIRHTAERADSVRRALERGGFAFTADARALRAIRKAHYLDWAYASPLPPRRDWPLRLHRGRIRAAGNAPDGPRFDRRGVWSRPAPGWAGTDMGQMASATGFFRHASADIRIALATDSYCGGSVTLALMSGTDMAAHFPALTGAAVYRQFAEPTDGYHTAAWTRGSRSLDWRRGTAQRGDARIFDRRHWFVAGENGQRPWLYLHAMASHGNMT
ncbi:hypothetical protein ATO6_00075 [Oceanicola sp. 22II-s10i]|uniref:hypothetical protein n=1 Tax=Oceanicola sp. 22II-s10i TaxID=1317116 RepID=UPI000B5227A1|nr:hypothetical protein [Oceanicola sp. 22II-s10i]OWU85399.1 hypothetical protein ATO6_00075 [Oceanicola sp. 22II-s10i]